MLAVITAISKLTSKQHNTLRLCSDCYKHFGLFRQYSWCIGQQIKNWLKIHNWFYSHLAFTPNQTNAQIPTRPIKPNNQTCQLQWLHLGAFQYWPGKSKGRWRRRSRSRQNRCHTLSHGSLTRRHMFDDSNTTTWFHARPPQLHSWSIIESEKWQEQREEQMFFI